MRTTIDIPEDILRRAKAAAALCGMKTKDLIAELLQTSLINSISVGPSLTGINRPILVTMKSDGRVIASMTKSQFFEVLDAEDVQKHGRLS